MILLLIVCQLIPSVSNIINDPIFQQFEWKEKILRNASKPWIAYVYRKVHDVTKQTEASNYKYFLRSVINKHLKYFHSQYLQMKKCKFFYYVNAKTWKKPLGGMTYTSTETNESLWFDMKIVEWKFALDSQLRLNLTMLLIDIQEVFQTCQRGNFSIQNFPSDLSALTFCGRHPVFTHYTSAPRVGLFTKFILDVRIYIALQYMVISRNSISNEAVEGIKNIFYVHRIHTIQLRLITYHIKVAKFQRICVMTTERSTAKIKYFDGPSVKSKVISIRIIKVCGTTYQLIAQTFDETIWQYWGEKLSQIQKYLLKGKSFSFEIPGYQCYDIRICGLQFGTLPGMYINLTVVNLVYTGYRSSDCKFGGIAFYDNQTHFLHLCNNYGSARPARNIYSTSSTLLLVIYTYPAHSSLKARLNISVTSCQPVTLESCEYDRRCKTPWTCHQWLKQIPELNFFEMLLFWANARHKTKVNSCFVLQTASDFFMNKSSHYSTETISGRTNCLSPFYPAFIKESNRVIHYTAFGFILGTVLNHHYCKAPSAFLTYPAVARVNVCQAKRFCNVNVNASGICDFCVQRRSHYFFIYRKIFTPQSRISNFGNSFFEPKTLLYNYEIQVSYLQLKKKTSLQSLSSHDGRIHWQSPTNYEVLVIRIKNQTNCFRPGKISLKTVVRVSVDSTKEIAYLDFRRERRRLNFELELSCRTPVKFISVSGPFQVPQYEYVSKNNLTELEVFWAQGVHNVNACTFCCAGSRCSSRHHARYLIGKWFKHKTEKTTLYFIFRKTPLGEGLSDGLYSWNSASSVCKRFGGYLPVFSSRRELEEFVSFIKLSPFVTVNAVFMGLFFSQVSNKFIIIHFFMNIGIIINLNFFRNFTG